MNKKKKKTFVLILKWINESYKLVVDKLTSAKKQTFVKNSKVDHEHPYMGLEAYREKYKDYFFGRKDDINQLVKLIKRNVVTVLSGDSGLGKTSLINAGLIPQLRELDYMPISLRLNFDNPQKSALEQVKESIENHIKTIDPSILAFKGKSLWEYFHQIEILSGFIEPVLIFDQFEELFTLGEQHPKQVEAIVAELTDLIENQIPLQVQKEYVSEAIPFSFEKQNFRILISLREDYLAHLENLNRTIPSLKTSRYRLLQMNGQQALEAIYQPGKAIIDQSEAFIILQLLLEDDKSSFFESQDLKQAEIEPFILSLVCYEINELRIESGKERITSDLLEHVQIKNIIKDFYKNSTDFLSKRGRAILEEELLTKDGFRKRQPEIDLVVPGILEESDLEILITKRVLRKDIWGEKEHYEFIHDKLIPPIKQSRDEQVTSRKKRKQSIYMGLIGSLIIIAIVAISLNSQDKVSKEKQRSEKLDSLRIVAINERRIADSLLKVAINGERIADSLKKEADRMANIAEINLKASISSQIQLDIERNKNEYERTHGRINYLKSLSENERKSAAKAIINQITGYLWSKGDQKSLDTLISILKNNESLIPDNYGLSESLNKIPDMGKDIEWPLVLEFSPERNIDYKKLNFSWRDMVPFIAESWGIPLPWPIYINDNLQTSKMNIRVPSSKSSKKDQQESKSILDSKSSKKDQQEPIKSRGMSKGIIQSNIDPEISEVGQKEYEQLDFEFPKYEGWVLVNKQNIYNERIETFFDTNKDNWEFIDSLQEWGDYYLAPKWTLPIFEESDVENYPSEYVVAFFLARALIDNPKFLLSNETMKFILAQEFKKNPEIVTEAWLNRDGFEGLRNDMIGFVKEQRSLFPLNYKLDALANYWKLDSDSAFSLAFEDQDYPSLEYVKLQGERENQSAASEIDSILQYNFDSYYSESAQYLPSSEPKIRVYLGDDIIGSFIEGDELRPDLKEELHILKAEIYKNHGIIIPGVRFRYADDYTGKNQIRIEMFNQSSENEEAKPISINHSKCINELINELKYKSIGFRNLWIDPKYVKNKLSEFDPKLKNWLDSHYTITDLKLILRAVTSPENDELSFYRLFLDEEAYKSIPPENTLIDLEWLLGSLVFWVHTDMDALNLYKIQERLRKTQRYRLNNDAYSESETQIARSIAQGLDQLSRANIEAAEQQFKVAIRQDQEEAINHFHDLYPSYSKFYSANLYEFLDSNMVPNPGDIENTWELYSDELYNLEVIFSDSTNQLTEKDRLKIDLALLHYYMEEDYIKKANGVIQKLLSQNNHDSWSNSNKYLLGYYLLKYNKRHKGSPENLPVIKNLLGNAISDWPEEEIGNIYLELLNLVDKEFINYNWSWNLLSHLVNQQPDNFWGNFYLGYSLAIRKEQFEFSKSALSYLYNARTLISQVNRDDKSFYSTWISFSESYAYYHMSQFINNPNSETFRTKSIQILQDLINSQDENPSIESLLEDIYSTLWSLFMLDNNREKAIRILDEGLRFSPESETFLRCKIFHLISDGEITEALQIADTLYQSNSEEEFNLFILALTQILAGHLDYEYSSNKFLETNHEYRDYIRMLLYYRLKTKGKSQTAERYLENRWMEIDSATWSKRIKNGDITAWREMLIGYYLDEVDYETVFYPLHDQTIFEKHDYKYMGQSFSALKCEGMFYNAILQGANGKIDSMIESLKQVISTNFPIYYEYVMAEYLLNKFEK